MTLVTQEDRSGCALACIAMLANKSYKWIRESWENSGRSKIPKIQAAGNGAGLSRGEIIDLMDFVGVDPAKFVAAPCIVMIKTPHGQHCVVISETGEVLDPQQKA